MRVPALLPLLLAGCMDYGLGGVERAAPGGRGGPSAADTGLAGETGGGDAPDEGGLGDGGAAGGGRGPVAGEVAIVELMIDPARVPDASGEWVEIANVGGATVDLAGCRLADEDVDDAPIEEVAPGSLVLEPGGRLVVCAEPSAGDNGGVACAGAVEYATWGGGLALSNTEDELLLLDPAGAVLDRVAWSEGFSPAGASVGLDPDREDPSANDDPGAWCAQRSAMPSGDAGTPGAPNDGCG